MARRRMIDPNFWQSEDVSKLSIFDRLLLIGMISQADDEGRGRANTNYLKSTIFPYDDIRTADVEKALYNISQKISVVFYDVDDSKYYSFTNWEKWQRVDKPQKSIIPPYAGYSKNHSENDSKNDSKNDSCVKEKKLKEKKISIPPYNPPLGGWGDVSETLLAALNDFEDMRKKIKKPLTDRAKAMLLTELKKLADDEKTQIAILNQSTMNCWQGVFSLKPGAKKENRQPSHLSSSDYDAYEDWSKKYIQDKIKKDGTKNEQRVP